MDNILLLLFFLVILGIWLFGIISDMFMYRARYYEGKARDEAKEKDRT